MATSSSRAAVKAALRPLAANAKASASTAAPFAARSISSSGSSSATPTSLASPNSSSSVDRISPATTSFPSMTHLPRPHGVHTASLTLMAYHPYNLDLYTSFAMHAANSLGIPTSNPSMLPTTKSLYTVLKSPFVHKKAQENFERKTHRRQIKVFDADRRVVDLWLRYLRQNGIGGVGMKAEVFEWVEYGFGSKEREEVDKLFERPMQAGAAAEAEIEKAAQELVRTLQGQADEQLSEEMGAESQTASASSQETAASATSSAPAEQAAQSDVSEKPVEAAADAPSTASSAESASDSPVQVAPESSPAAEAPGSATAESSATAPTAAAAEPPVAEAQQPVSEEAGVKAEEAATPAATAAPKKQKEKKEPAAKKAPKAKATSTKSSYKSKASAAPSSEADSADKTEKLSRTGGTELVEGSDDVVAGATLPEAQPEGEAKGHAPPAKDGGEPASS